MRLLQIRRLESVADRLKADAERRGCGAAGAARRSLWMRRWLRLFSVGRWARLVLKVKHSGSWETIVYGVMGGRFSYRGALLGFETLSPRCGQSETWRWRKTTGGGGTVGQLCDKVKPDGGMRLPDDGCVWSTQGNLDVAIIEYFHNKIYVF